MFYLKYEFFKKINTYENKIQLNTIKLKSIQQNNDGSLSILLGSDVIADVLAFQLFEKML